MSSRTLEPLRRNEEGDGPRWVLVGGQGGIMEGGQGTTGVEEAWGGGDEFVRKDRR